MIKNKYIYVFCFGLFILTSCNQNTKNFEKLIKFTPTNDVENIKYKDDVLLNASYWLGFECNPNTSVKIINDLGLYEDIYDRGNYSDYGYYPKDWWNPKTIDSCKQFSSRSGYREQIFFWYNTKTRKAFLLKILN